MARQRIVAISGVDTASRVTLGAALLGWAVVLGVGGFIFWQVTKKDKR